jgi:hypothetical protein
MKIDRKQIRYSLQLLLHLQKNKVTGHQDGYAMLITSILAILMFSMLSVYLFSANLYKSVANAVVDSGSTFYAAESGMNKRSNIVRNRFEGYSQPIGNEPSGTTIAMQMQNCIDNFNSTDAAAIATLGAGDLACDVSDFDYKESVWKATIGDGEKFESQFNNDPDIKYRAYSFVKRVTSGDPEITKIPPGEDFAGLNMQEYKYRLYSTALKNTSNSAAVSAQTLLQMDFNSRVIPIFQFAAFYDGDMEITSSSDMNLAGPIHSNNNIYLAPGGSLTVGQITAARRRDTAGVIIPGTGGIFKSLSRVPTHGGLTPGFRFRLASNPYISVLNTAGTAWLPINTRVSAADLAANLDVLRENTAELTMPASSSLSSTGDYNTKADLQVVFDPDNGQGFTMTSVQRTVNAATGVVTAAPTTFTGPMLRSLRQPVMLVALNGTEQANFCINTAATNLAVAPSLHPTPNPGANFTSATLVNNLNATPTATNIAESQALRTALANTPNIYTFTQLNNSSMSLLGDLKTRYMAALGVASLTPAQDASTPRAIANRAGNCFLPAPIQVLNGPQDRQEERRPMRILQSNIHSLTIWNRDGLYADAAGTGTISAAGQVFARAAADTSAPVGSYAWLGLAASDRSEGGLVWHFSVKNDGTYPTAYPAARPAAPAVDTVARVSNYGFGFSGGRWLPGPLTLATDQIAYVQGDFNNPGGVQPGTGAGSTSIGDTTVFSGVSPALGGPNPGAGVSRNDNLTQKRSTPAAVMADAIGVLSNACVGADGQLNCFNVTAGTALPRAATTSINAAFFAGTTPLGGLNNYMRMMENWGGSGALSIFRYRGSFVSTGTPLKVSGGYYGGGDTARNIVRNFAGVVTTTPTYYNIPGRDYGYDTSFNTVTGLPPLTPKAVYLKQKVFRRDYNNERN